MGRISAIVGAPDETRVQTLIKQGLSLRQLEQKTPYSLAQIRSYKKFLFEEQLYQTPVSGEYKQALEGQLKRLHSLLHDAQKRPRNIELLLKIEQRLAEITKTLIALDTEENANDEEPQIDAHEAEIGSLISIFQKVTEDCKDCRMAVRGALKQLNRQRADDTENSYDRKAR